MNRTEPPKVITEHQIERLVRVLEERGPLVVEWRHYRGSRGPTLSIVQDADALRSLVHAAAAGDAFYFWDFCECCTENLADSGVVGDAKGEPPPDRVY
jgi:hypothetical protein